LQCDELWSFVDNKGNKQWVWLALDADTREIVAVYIGARDEAAAAQLWTALPPVYRQCAVAYTDFWAAYAAVFPSKRHQAVGKETGLTSYVVRARLRSKTIQQHLAPTGVSISAENLVVLKVPGESHWRNLVLCSSLQCIITSLVLPLALGGATVDFDHLRQDCSRESFIEFLNPAVLLQCRALESSPGTKEQLTQGFKDERVGLVIAFTPVNASIFGPDGLNQIQVPIVIGASGYDPAAPLVSEQAVSFTWLTAPERYLLLARGGAHIPQLTALINRILSPSLDRQQLDEEIALFRSNARALLLAFLQVYLANRSDYEPYLQPYHVRTLGDPPFDFSLIRSLTQEQLSQMLRR
jgi:IS1 family transposase